MMSPLSEQAHEIAQLIVDEVSVETVYATIPGRVVVFSAIVAPAAGWGTFDGGTFCSPDVNWEIILVAGTTDYGQSMDWFFARICELIAIDELAVTSWSQPQLIATGGDPGNALSVRVQLAARPLAL